MSVLDRSTELILEYRALIEKSSPFDKPGALAKDAEELLGRINASFDEIPPGNEELQTGALFFRGLGFPFRGRQVTFGKTLPDYSREALVRELHGWDSTQSFRECDRLIRAIETFNYTAEDLNSELQRIFMEASEPLKATPEAPIAYVDLETTGSHPAVAEIIECGMLVDYGDRIESFDELFSVKNGVIRDGVLPFADCHNITPEMIEGKRKWSEAEELHAILADPATTVVAHHLAFEAKWFAHTVPGYLKARSPYFARDAHNGEPARHFDSRFAAAFLTGSDRGTLEDFVEVMGGKYEDAHRALNDVAMMKTALDALKTSA